MVPSWTGYLLQRQRLTKNEQETIKKVWRLHVGEQIPLERYYLCVNKKLDTHQTTEAPALTTPTIPLHLGTQGLPERRWVRTTRFLWRADQENVQHHPTKLLCWLKTRLDYRAL